jgi:hypothetical protein
VRGGGITGLVSTTVLDSGSLSEQDADELRDRVARVGSDAPSETPQSKPDEQSVLIAIDGPDGTQTIRGAETELSEPQRALIDLVTRSPHREEHLGSPGDRHYG